MILQKHSNNRRLVAVAIVCCAIHAVAGASESTEERVSVLATNAGRYTALKNLAAPEREAIRTALRDRISSGRLRIDSDAHLLLLDMGDGLTLDETMKAFEGKSYITSKSMQRKMQSGSHPAIIARVAVALFHDEPTEMTVVNSEFLAYPISVRSAAIIRNVLINSPEFSDEVREWAATLSLRDADRLRATIRAWWTSNKARFEDGQYLAVVPGLEPTDADPPSDGVSDPKRGQTMDIKNR